MLHRLLCCLSPRVWCAPSPRSLCVLLCPALSCLGGVRWLLGAGSEVAPSVVRVGVRESGGGLRAQGRARIMWGMTTSTTGTGGSFWTKPLGQIIAERKGRAYYRPAGFGTAKTGLIELKSDGRMIYTTLDGPRSIKERFNAGDIVAARIETAADYVERVSGARVAGGAVVGGILLGPLGLALGAGAGVLAKQKSGAAEYLVVDLADGRTVTVEIASKHVIKAREMRDIIAPTA